MKLLTIVGARPQFVKAAVVSKAIVAAGGVTEILVHTGQHFDANMSSIFFDEMGIPAPAHNLGIGGGSHGANTGRAIEAIESVIVQERPDAVMVYGDTDSTLAGAVAAAKLSVPVIHVEAGLRSFNRRMPEEVNRVLTDHVSAMLLAPSQVAVDNLAHEGIAGDGVKLVGDVMFDAVVHFSRIAKDRSQILQTLGLEPGGYVLATLHRKENVDDRARLAAILAGFDKADIDVVLPLHPRTRKQLGEFGLTPSARVRIVEAVGYLDMMQLEAAARMIATDSGGVQKEAYFHRVPCAVLRDETEWVELIDLGANTLVGADTDRIVDALTKAWDSAPEPTLYGGGVASERVVDAVKSL